MSGLLRPYRLMTELRNEYLMAGRPCVVIWGMGLVGDEVYRTLCYHDITVYAFASNEAVNEKKIKGRPVLGIDDIIMMGQPLIIIASFVVRPIYEQLARQGFTNVRAILDTIKYPIFFVEQEMKQKPPAMVSDRLLLELYGNIGDVLIKIGIVRAIVRHYGRERVWLLAETKDIGDLLSMLTPNVIVLERERFAYDLAYHFRMLNQLNGLCFGQTVVLADVRLYANRRLLNEHNFFVGETIYDDAVPDDEYLPEMTWRFISHRLGLAFDMFHSSISVLDSQIEKVHFDGELPKIFVVVNMGATKEIRHYPHHQFVPVVRFLISSGLDVVFIGQGEYDVAFYNDVICRLTPEEQGGVVSMIGLLSLPESMAVINRALFFVGTDSGMWHASYVMGRPSVVIYGGGEYGNFMHRDGNIYYAMADFCDCFGCRWFCMRRDSDGYAECIASVSPYEIIKGCKSVMEGVR